MGFTPQQFYDMSHWEFGMIVEGWNRAHGDGKPQPPTDEEFEAAMAKADAVFARIESTAMH